MRLIQLSFLPAALALAACASYADDMSEDPYEEPLARAPQGECDAELVQDFVGQMVSVDLGAQIMAKSGAARLRWGPPNSAMTMDYRPDRVNVFYDDARVTERITCG